MMYFILIVLMFVFKAYGTCSFSQGDAFKHENEIHRLASIPGPLFGFGQSVMKKDSFMLCSMLQQLGGIDYEFLEYDPMLMYGLTEKTTITLIFPIIAENINRAPLQGIGNITFALEHALYNHFEDDANFMWTVLGSVLLPTAKNAHQASLDVSLAQPSTSFFIGTTAHHMSQQWYVYAALGALFQLPKHMTHYGTAILYELGFSFPLRYTQSSYLSFMLEASGRFRPSDVTNGVIQDSTGSNRIWFGPVLHWVYSDWTLQAGFQYPISERFFAPRTIPSYRVALQVAFG